MVTRDELTADEQLILGNWRRLKQEEKDAIKAAYDAFVDWIKRTMADIWERVKSAASRIWQSLTR